MDYIQAQMSTSTHAFAHVIWWEGLGCSHLKMAACTSTPSNILQEFQVLSEDERHRVQLQLLEGTEVRTLLLSRLHY